MTDQMKEKVIREVFDSFDTNGDNSISMTELKAAVEKFENRKITDVELNKMVKEVRMRELFSLDKG